MGSKGFFSCLLAVVTGLGFFICPMTFADTQSFRAVSEGFPEWEPLDAQSTTGPVPPAGMLGGVSPEALDYEVVIAGVPVYIWYNGCGPTAAGMVVGYWDGLGFEELVDGEAAEQTPAVDDMISSSGNYNDYCLPIDYSPNLLPDLSELPIGDEHPNDCVADFMETSQSIHANYYGWSWFTRVDDALRGYVALVAPQYRADVESIWWSALTWDRFCTEIDAGRPMVLLVDTNADGFTDHFVTAIGYGEEDGKPMYACLNTWDESVHWYEFAKYAEGQPWGIYGVTTFVIDPPNLTRITLQAPADRSVMSTPPTFAWIVDGGMDNIFAVDAALSPAGPFFSTYNNLHEAIRDTSWTMPQYIWDMIPSGRRVFWRVRGVDLQHEPLAVIVSDEIRSFDKE